MENPHIAEALIGGAIASIPILIGQLIAIGSLKRIFKDYPPHRHINGKVIYPKDYTPNRAENMHTAGD